MNNSKTAERAVRKLKFFNLNPGRPLAMSARVFKIYIALLAVIILSSASPILGPPIGLIFLVAVFSIFYNQPASMDSGAVGANIELNNNFYGLTVIYMLVVLFFSREFYSVRRRGDATAVRLSAAKMLTLIALPLIAWLSLWTLGLYFPF